jgi:hypothetical protein
MLMMMVTTEAATRDASGLGGGGINPNQTTPAASSFVGNCGVILVFQIQNIVLIICTATTYALKTALSLGLSQ